MPEVRYYCQAWGGSRPLSAARLREAEHRLLRFDKITDDEIARPLSLLDLALGVPQMIQYIDKIGEAPPLLRLRPASIWLSNILRAKGPGAEPGDL